MSTQDNGRTRTKVRARRGGTTTRDRTRKTDYEPVTYAFRFPNTFVNEVVTIGVSVGFWQKGKDIETDGLCGGMAFTSLDFFHAKRPVPALTPRDFAGSEVPPDEHPLAKYIYSRQMDSVFRGRGLLDGVKFIRWSGKSTATLVRRTEKNEIPKIKRSIDKGKPVVLGLIGTTKRRKVGDNHQVVCYGYAETSSGETELHIYDPNEPVATPPRRRDHRADPPEDTETRRGSYEVLLSKRVPGSASPYRSDRPTHPRKTEDVWRGFFVQRYRPKNLGPRIIGSDTGSDKTGGPGTDRPPVQQK